jgi:hypothetical protein
MMIREGWLAMFVWSQKHIIMVALFLGVCLAFVELIGSLVKYGFAWDFLWRPLAVFWVIAAHIEGFFLTAVLIVVVLILAHRCVKKVPSLFFWRSKG